MSVSFYALIPAYEPEETLLSLLPELRESGFKILVVDDGSGPEYEQIFRKAERYASVLQYPVNLGKGHALKLGFQWIGCRANEGDVVVTVDADGQHKVSDALRLAEAAAISPGTLVLGSRRLTGAVPLRSRFGNTVTRLVFWLSTGRKVYDTQTGLRAFTCGMIPAMQHIDGERYEYEMNVLLACAENGTPIREETIETIYRNGNAGSHFDTIRDSIRVYRGILKFSSSSLLSFLVDYVMYVSILWITASFGGYSSLVAANVGARIISSVFNYTLNRKYVFRSSEPASRTAPRYFLLAAGILAGNTCLLSFLAGVLGMNSLAAKIVTEICFFFLSYLIQKRVIFHRRRELTHDAA